MLRQKIQNRQPRALEGVGVIALIALSVLAGSAFFSWLEGRLGKVASLLFIAYGCAIAWFLLNWYVMSFIYTANADCLRICRAYGKRERFMADVWLNQVFAYGTPEEMKQRCPDARMTQATRSQCALAPLALAYREDGKNRIAVIQPDDALREHLIRAIRARRK